MYHTNITVTSLLDLMFIFSYLHVQNKSSPLMVASQNGHVDVVNVLLQHGASVNLQNKVNLHMLTFLFIKATIICMTV